MASRGRGRGWGRGRGGSSHSYAAQVPYVLFPEDVTLPDVKIDEIDPNMKKLLNWSFKLQNYWKASPYLLEETTSSKKSQRMDITRFFDKKQANFTRDSLSQVLMFNGFPQELAQGASKRMKKRKKFRWNPESELKKLDFFEQQEKTNQGKEDANEDADENEKKDGEDEEEEENVEEEEEIFSDDDYNQTEYFDDDEDDYNDADGGNDEPIY